MQKGRVKNLIKIILIPLVIFCNKPNEDKKKLEEQGTLLNLIEMNVPKTEDAYQNAADLIIGNTRYTGSQGEPVVMVHGNTGYPSDWDNTVNYFLQNGWTSSKIIRPNWGSKTCAACNDHYGSELDTVKQALQQALSLSTTGKIDVMGHSMGATLAAKAILDLGIANKVRTFVGIAGAFRGLNSCGVYPYNVQTPTCGQYGLSIGSPLINSLANKRFGQYQYAIYSWVDEIVCNCGAGYNMTCCYVYGVHTSRPHILDGYTSYSTVPYGHFGVLYYTSSVQRTYCAQQ